MDTIPVRILYMTGLKQSLFSNVRLLGSWDNWSTEKTMTPVTGDDGCPAFTAVVTFNASDKDKPFQWGVRLNGPAGDDQWGIMTEVRDVNSSKRERSFVLKEAPAGGPMQEERYYFTQCRRLGAQRVPRPDGTLGGALRFGVWAPNAQRLRVVFGFTWKDGGAQQPTRDTLPVDQIMGGYIANNGTGVDTGVAPLTMHKLDDGVWITDLIEEDFGHYDHRPYMFEVTKDNGKIEYRTDLCSRCQIGAGATNPGGSPYTGQLTKLNGLVSCSAVIDPDTVTKFFKETTTVNGKEVPVYPERNFIPQDKFWNEAEYRVKDKTYVSANEFDPQRPVPRRVEDLVIYELHLGALGFGKKEPGDLEDAIQLLDYLIDLGVNAVELLPMSEFGDIASNWGYSTSHYFAVEYSGGGRDKYKFFVKACHQRGMAVIMDVVYNHYNHHADQRAEWMYDTDTDDKNVYYWYESPDGPRPASYLDNLSTAYAPRYHEEQVRKLFTSSAAALAEEFHVDGFRVDQTTSIHAYNVRHADGSPVPSANIFGIKLLREWTRTIRAIKPGIMLMAEDHSGWDKVTQQPDRDGLGFDATWYADYHHHLVGRNYGSNYAKLLPTAAYGSDVPLAMDWFAGALESSGQQKVVYHTCHDEAGNAAWDDPDPDKRTHRTIVVAVRGDPGGTMDELTRRYAEARCRFAFGVTLFSAGTPMFLFGEEVGCQKDFKYNDVLKNREDLAGYQNDEARGAFLFRFYADAIRLRLGRPGLRSRNLKVLHAHNVNRVLAFKRWGEGQEFLMLASLNNRPFNRPGYAILHPDIWGGSRWHEIFNSDAPFYRGDGVGNWGATIAGQPGRFEAVIPANGFVIFERV